MYNYYGQGYPAKQMGFTGCKAYECRVSLYGRVQIAVVHLFKRAKAGNAHN